MSAVMAAAVVGAEALDAVPLNAPDFAVVVQVKRAVAALKDAPAGTPCYAAVIDDLQSQDTILEPVLLAEWLSRSVLEGRPPHLTFCARRLTETQTRGGYCV